MRYAEIVMIQGEEGRGLVDALYNVEGVVAHGVTEESLNETVAHLSQWDSGDNAEYDTEDVPVPWGTSDTTWEHLGYILSANLGLGYVSLAKKL